MSFVGYMLFSDMGCSDGVLNPSGVRFGSSEIYGVLERFSRQIDDTLCVGQRRPHDTDERVLLFIKMRQGHKFTGVFEEEVRKAIRTGLSRRHEPSYVFEVTEIPVRGLWGCACLFRC